MLQDEDDLSGQKIAGRYALKSLLGHGGMGAVYLATQEPLGRDVALKVIRSELSRDKQASERFKREAQTVSQLVHPGIVTIFDFGDADGVLFIAMELLDGESLRQRLESRGRFTARDSVVIVRDICLALAAAHARSVMHRDLKPDNVMLVRQPGRPDVVKLLDFGVAKLLDKAPGQATLTQAGMLVGTPGYLAPEVVLQGVSTDLRSDLYAVGVMWFEMLTGRALFTAPTPMALVMRHATERPPRADDLDQTVPGPLADLIDQLLAKDPAHRPASAADVVTHLEALLASGSSLPSSLMLPPVTDPGKGDTFRTIDGTGFVHLTSKPSGPVAAPPALPSIPSGAAARTVDTPIHAPVPAPSATAPLPARRRNIAPAVGGAAAALVVVAGVAWLLLAEPPKPPPPKPPPSAAVVVEAPPSAPPSVPPSAPPPSATAVVDEPAPVPAATTPPVVVKKKPPVVVVKKPPESAPTEPAEKRKPHILKTEIPPSAPVSAPVEVKKPRILH